MSCIIQWVKQKDYALYPVRLIASKIWTSKNVYNGKTQNINDMSQEMSLLMLELHKFQM